MSRPNAAKRSGRIAACGFAALVVSLVLVAPPASALNTVADDQRVTGYQEVLGASYAEGSLCVGNDCVVPESFSFDTIRLKENNTRIGFDDTSVGAFPANDWTIVANDSPTGGRNYLAFQDVTGGNVLPFVVEAGAPGNSLLVAPGGNVGIGTASPASKLAVAGSLSQLIDDSSIEILQPVNGNQILAQLAGLPLSSWQYTGSEQRHLGPTGQQLNTAFGLGAADGYIAPTDVGAVALAATKALAAKQETDVQALNAAVNGQTTNTTSTTTTVAKQGKAIKNLRKQNKRLKKSLNKLAKKVDQLLR
jgi:hypothetical protein